MKSHTITCAKCSCLIVWQGTIGEVPKTCNNMDCKQKITVDDVVNALIEQILERLDAIETHLDMNIDT